MARPPSTHSRHRLRNYSLYLTPEEADEAAQLASDLGIVNERGQPSRSYLFIKLVEEEKLRQQKKNSEKITQKTTPHD